VLRAVEFNFSISRPNNGFIRNRVGVSAVRSFLAAHRACFVRGSVNVNYVGHWRISKTTARRRRPTPKLFQGRVPSPTRLASAAYPSTQIRFREVAFGLLVALPSNQIGRSLVGRRVSFTKQVSHTLVPSFSVKSTRRLRSTSTSHFPQMSCSVWLSFPIILRSDQRGFCFQSVKSNAPAQKSTAPALTCNPLSARAA
jgi:hypothetical protein